MSDTVKNAVAFLRENPERHITGSLFVDTNGATLNDVTSPKTDERICGMCIIGALARELDYDYKSAMDSNDEDLADVWGDILAKAGLPIEYAKNTGFIWKMNDEGQNGARSELCRSQNLANPKVLDFVETLIKETEE